jgi:N-acetylneuraminic acid mutarotase
MKKLLTLLLCLSFATTYAQKVKGIVLDIKTKKPIEEVHISLGKKVLITNKKGEFSFLKTGKTDKIITFSHLGYKLYEVKYNGERNLKIYLKQKTENLNEVLVSNKKLKRRIKYNKLPEMENKAYSFASVLLKDKIYVFGGDQSREIEDVFLNAMLRSTRAAGSISSFLAEARKYSSFYKFSNQFSVFDLSKEKWTTEAIDLQKRAYHSAINYDNKIFLMGGKRLSKTKRREYLEDKIEVYDADKNTLEIDKTNPHQTVGLETHVYKDKIIVLGGSYKETRKGVKKYMKEVHSYNPKTGLWHLITKLPLKKETTSILLKHKLYFFGGLEEKYSNKIVSLNLITGKIIEEKTLFANVDEPAISKEGNTIFLYENNKFVTYNTRSRVLKEYSIDLNVFSPKMHIYNNKLYVIGGFKKEDLEKRASNTTFSIDLDEFDITRIRNRS